MLIKAVFPRRFSFTCYAAAQVAIDLESGYHLVTHTYPVHRWAHSYVGAVGVGIATALIAGPLTRWAHRRCAPWLASRFGGWLYASDLSWSVVFASALVGTLSHVLLDGIMHGDVHPLWPFSSANPQHGLMTGRAIELSCVAAGALACLIAALRRAPAAARS